MLVLFVILFVVGLLAFLSYRRLSEHVDTSFEADLDTTYTSFTLGEWTSAAGLFVSNNPIDINVQEASRLTLNQGLAPSCNTTGVLCGSSDAAFQLRQVRLDAIDLPERTEIKLAVVGGWLQMNLRRPNASSEPVAYILADQRSSLPPGGSRAHQAMLGDRRWAVYAADGQQLHLSLHFNPGRLPEEEDVPLLKGSMARFEERGRSRVSGTDNKLILPSHRSSLRLAHSLLRLDDLHDATIRRLSLVPSAAGKSTGNISALRLQMTGHTRTINVVSSFNLSAANEGDIRFDRLQAGVSSRLLYAILIGSVTLFALLASVATLLGSLATMVQTQMQTAVFAEKHPVTARHAAPDPDPRG